MDSCAGFMVRGLGLSVFLDEKGQRLPGASLQRGRPRASDSVFLV